MSKAKVLEFTEFTHYQRETDAKHKYLYDKSKSANFYWGKKWNMARRHE